MVKATVGGTGEFERAPWPDGDWLPFKIVKVEMRPKYNEPDKEEVSLVLASLDGETKGQWAYISVNHLNKNGQPNLVFDEDGKPLSKWASIISTVKPTFDYTKDDADPELKDCLDGFLWGFVEPASNPKYCKFLKYKPMKAEDIARFGLEAEVSMEDAIGDDLPF